MTRLSKERLDEIRTTITAWYGHVTGKVVALALMSELDAVRADLAELVAALPKCELCHKLPATCVGSYEGQPEETRACDECCGHGCEDGLCDEQALAPILRRLEARRG
jgi:hypothetical protein